MSETRRLLEAAAALSQSLRANAIPHAFYGSVLTAVLANSSQSDVSNICLRYTLLSLPPGDLLYRGRWAESASSIPAGARLSGWQWRFYDNPFSMDQSAACYVPSIHTCDRGEPLPRCPPALPDQRHTTSEIEILPAGETGPRHLDTTTVMKMQGLPFLTISEFIRSKLKTWMIRGEDRDAQDITYVLSRYWNRVDINRIPEQDMNLFVSRNVSAGPAWSAIKRKYGM